MGKEEMELSLFTDDMVKGKPKDSTKMIGTHERVGQNVGYKINTEGINSLVYTNSAMDRK